ncbi:hypothetical protein RRG08_024361 [Elysia crispata]|uniref:Uncharacterized protein n=1 Tax=Elysia crispata TaxID=231223 RepID=A0AAE0ZML0_9GAST|nr:hypothetical protein RRG08_024361 [Elysia crispata]
MDLLGGYLKAPEPRHSFRETYRGHSTELHKVFLNSEASWYMVITQLPGTRQEDSHGRQSRYLELEELWRSSAMGTVSSGRQESLLEGRVTVCIWFYDLLESVQYGD